MSGHFCVVVGLVYRGAQLIGVVYPQRNVGFLLFSVEFKISARLFRFLFKRTNARSEFMLDVPDTLHIRFGFGELFFGFVLLEAIFCDTRAFLEYSATLFALF